MIESKFGELEFDFGYYTKLEVNLFSQSQIVPVDFSAYYENDGITEQQESVYSQFLEEKDKQIEKLKSLLIAEFGIESKQRFSLSELYIERTGELAFLFDDSENPDEGIVVQLLPKVLITSQSVYLQIYQGNKVIYLNPITMWWDFFSSQVAISAKFAEKRYT